MYELSPSMRGSIPSHPSRKSETHMSLPLVLQPSGPGSCQRPALPTPCLANALCLHLNPPLKRCPCQPSPHPCQPTHPPTQGEVVCGGSKCGACMAYMGGMVAVNALDYMLAGVDLLGLTALGVNATFMLAVLPALLMQWQMRNRIRQKYGIKVRPPAITQYHAVHGCVVQYAREIGMGQCRRC